MNNQVHILIMRDGLVLQIPLTACDQSFKVNYAARVHTNFQVLPNSLQCLPASGYVNTASILYYLIAKTDSVLQQTPPTCSS